MKLTVVLDVEGIDIVGIDPHNVIEVITGMVVGEESEMSPHGDLPGVTITIDSAEWT